jgi:beta-galactosidase
VAGSHREPARAAIVFHWDSWWASEADSHPTSRLRYHREALDWYSAFLAAGVRVDVVPLGTSLDGYQVVVAPILHMVNAATADRLTRYVERGGNLVTTYFSGIVDDDDHVWLGGYPGALRDLLGIRIEEFGPLLDDERVELDLAITGTEWTDRIEVTGSDVDVLARYKTGDQAGRPAITRRGVGSGSAAYVSTRLGPAGLRPVLDELLTAAGVASELAPDARGKVELVTRRAGDTRFRFLINRTDAEVTVTDLDGELLLGRRSEGALVLGPRAVAVLRTDG